VVAAISRGDFTENSLENDRVCGKHFVRGSAALNFGIDSMRIGSQVYTLVMRKTQSNQRQSKLIWSVVPESKSV